MCAAREPETAHTRSAAGVAVLIDASDVRDCVVRWAAEDAALHGEPLTLLMTLPRDDLTVRNPEVVRRLRKLKRHSAVTLLEHARCIAESAVGGGGSPWVTEQMIFAAPVDAMVSAAQRHRLVVVGRDSISGGMLRRSPRPVAVVPDDGRDRRRRDSVLLGVAGAPTPDDATAVAFDEASKRRVPLTVLQVGCGTARSNSGAGPDVRARFGSVERALPECGRQSGAGTWSSDATAAAPLPHRPIGGGREAPALRAGVARPSPRRHRHDPREHRARDRGPRHRRCVGRHQLTKVK